MVGRRAALGAGLLLLALSPVVDRVLRLDSIATALLLALAVVPTTMVGPAIHQRLAAEGG